MLIIFNTLKKTKTDSLFINNKCLKLFCLNPLFYTCYKHSIIFAMIHIAICMLMILIDIVYLLYRMHLISVN